MKIVGTKMLRADSLVLAKPWRKRLDDPGVDELAGSIRSNGLINPLLVRAADKLIVCGADRYVAMVKILKQPMVECRLCAAADDEIVRLQITENLHRRHAPGELDELRRAYVATRAVEIETERNHAVNLSGHVSRKVGHRRVSAKGEAIRERAAIEGADEEAVKKSVQRAEIAVAPPKPAGAGLALPAPAEELRAGLADAHVKLGRVQAILTKLLELPREVAERCDLARLHRQVHQAAAAVKVEIPVRACVYCKLLPARLKQCAGCEGTGYLVSRQMTDIPKELLAEGKDAGIFVKPNVFARLVDL